MPTECDEGYPCRSCREVICRPCDIGQPDCPHDELCADCRMSCGECRADATDDAQGPDYSWGLAAVAGLRRLHDPDHGRMTHTGRPGDPA